MSSKLDSWSVLFDRNYKCDQKMRVGRNVNHHFFPLSSLLFRDGGNWCVTCRRLYWRVGYSIVCSRRCIGITVAGSGVSITACPTCSRRGATIIHYSK